MTILDRIIRRWRIAMVRPHIALGTRILDIGTFDGHLFNFLSFKEGIGVDLDLDERAHFENQNVRLIKGAFPTCLPDTRCFDVIVLMAVLEHIPADQQKELAVNCERYLSPGGKLVITVPSHKVDYILAALRWLRLIDGMHLEQHYGFSPEDTLKIFSGDNMKCKIHCTFQLGLNNLFVFEKLPASPIPITGQKKGG